MAAIDFPNSPSINDQFTAAGKTWVWTGTSWDAVDTSGGGGGSQTLQEVTELGNTTNQGIILTNTAATHNVVVSVDANGNIIFNAGSNQNFHFSGDVIAFSSLTPPAANWWNSLPIATVSTLGGVKIGSGLSIDGSGVLSVTGGGGTTAIWGNITGTLSNQSDLWTALTGKASSVHTHAISDVINLQTTLDAKVSGSSSAGNVAYWSTTTGSITGDARFFWDATNKKIRLQSPDQSKEFTIEINNAGNIVFTAGTNQNFHFSGDVIAFSGLTPPASTWWDNLPVATASTLGGIKIGSGLSINGSGVVSVTGGGGTTAIWGNITGTLSNQLDLQTALDSITRGHTIYNSSGVLQTHREKLKFSRLDVTDDSGNNQTVVTRPSDTYVAVSPPSSPVSGDTWISSESLKAYVYYDSFWVEDGAAALGVTQAYVDAKFATRYSRRSDVTSTYAYCGTAAFGSADSAAAWYITRIPINANGTVGTVQRSPNNSIWNNRASLTYT